MILNVTTTIDTIKHFTYSSRPFHYWDSLKRKIRILQLIPSLLAFKRRMAIYNTKGYSLHWIAKRIQGAITRSGLIKEWNKRGIKKRCLKFLK